MTTPDLSGIIPLKWKAWVSVLSSVLTLVVPYVIAAEDLLPSPWPLVIGFVIALLGALGVYKAPYVPNGTVLAPAPTQTSIAPQLPTDSGYQDPWK